MADCSRPGRPAGISTFSYRRARAGSARGAGRPAGARTIASPSAGSPTAAAGSIEMHDVFDAGDTLVFEGPRNAFYLGTAEPEVLFVIGGIGVTPILPMIQE